MYPWMLYYYKHPNDWQRSHIFCSIWRFIDWGLYITQSILFAWASIERHILIFHDGLVSTRNKRFFVHYLPLILLLSYCLIFYGIIYFFPTCENFFNNFDVVCISSCLLNDNAVLHMWEIIVHQILPTLIIIIFSIALLLRVLQQKHRIHQVIHWRKHRKMTIQLLSISLIYLVFSFPNTLMIFMHLCGLPEQIGAEADIYVGFFSYLVILLFPFVCILPLPELQNKIMKILHLQRRTTSIHPEILVIKNNKNIRNTLRLENIVQ